MAEKNTEKWNFQKDGKPFDELPDVVKRNLGFLYEYIRTGKLPNINIDEVSNASRDNVEEIIKYDTEAAKKIIEFAKRNMALNIFNRHLHENDYKIKEFYDEYFIKSGYYKTLFTFEEIYNDISHFPVDGPSSLKKMRYEVKRAQGIHKIYFSRKIERLGVYANVLWGEIIILIAENRLKELEEYKSL